MSQIRTKIKFKYKKYLIFPFFTINIQNFDLELDIDEFDVSNNPLFFLVFPMEYFQVL